MLNEANRAVHLADSKFHKSRAVTGLHVLRKLSLFAAEHYPQGHGVSPVHHWVSLRLDRRDSR